MRISIRNIYVGPGEYGDFGWGTLLEILRDVYVWLEIANNN